MHRQPSSAIKRSTSRDISRSLTSVGRKKAVGYLPLRTVKTWLATTPVLVSKWARRKGLATMVFPSGQCRIGSGAIYVYHRAALRQLLASRTDVLLTSGLSAHPDQFVRQIAKRTFEPTEPAYRVIAEAFADRFLLEQSA